MFIHLLLSDHEATCSFRCLVATTHRTRSHLVSSVYLRDWMSVVELIPDTIHHRVALILLNEADTSA